ncbi:Cysteine desulfurase [Chitinispirillum alkaliphilum]|nr:Cysteine desulfurase [Chitinispirillum alkaliphilum]
MALVEKVREDFPILNRKINGNPLVYLDNAATTQKPIQVLEKVKSFYENWNSNIHRGVHCLSEKAGELYEESRKTVRDFINAKDEKEIVFTRGTTEAVNLVASCFGEKFVEEGDEIVISEMEHHSNLIPWQNLCKKRNAHLKTVPFNDEGALQIDHLKSVISSKTKLISVTYISNVFGLLNPVKEIVSIAHKHNIPVFIDGAQAVPHTPIDVIDLNCDFFAFSGHKLYAETGVGVLYGKEDWLNRLPPYQTGGGMIDSVDLHTTVISEIPQKFEAGTPNISGVLSLGAAIEYIESVGVEQICSYEQELLQYMIQKLKSIGSIRIFGSVEQRNGIVSFNLKDTNSYDVALLLNQSGIAVRSGSHCAQPLMKHYGVRGMVRASLAFYNTKEEIDRFIQSIARAESILL